MHRSIRQCSLLLFGLLLVAAAHAQQLADPPSRAELVLWTRVDDLDGMANNDLVTLWLDRSGRGHHLTAATEHAPSFHRTAVAGKPGVAFASDTKADPKIIHKLTAPFRGEWRGMTILVVGSNLSQSTWFGSAPGQAGELRMIGGTQHTGSKAGIGNLQAMAAAPGVQLLSLSAGIHDDNVFRIMAYNNGVLLHSGESPFPLWGVLTNNASFGAYLDWQGWQGAFAEIIVYNGLLSDEERKLTERYLQVKYGLTEAKDDDPKAPAGYLPPQPKVLPEVKAKPVIEGLRLWARADDIEGTDQLPIASWQTAIGGAPILAPVGHAPIYLQSAINGRAALRFDGANDGKEPRTTHFIELPTTGVWEEMTLIVVGSNLNRPGLFDTAPNNAQTLRHIGGLQHCSARELGVAAPFPLMNGTMMGTVTIGKLGEAGQYLTTHTHGYLQRRAESPEKITPLLFKQTTFGIINRKEVAFNGMIAEILLYDRPLSEAERYQTEQYLAEKYALPLKSPEQIAREPKPRSAWSVRLPHMPREVSWIGNSESGKDSWVQGGVFHSIVMPDGTVASISVWDEGHKEIGYYKDGKSVLGKGIPGGGGTLFSDGQYLYAGISGMGKKFAGVKRLSLELKEEKWPEGVEGRIRFETPQIWDEIQGITRVGDELFVTCRNIDEVQVFDVNSGSAKRTFPLKAPERLLAGKDGLLWIGTKEGVAQFTTAGKPTGKKITGVVAGALAFDNEGRLLLADSGERQQVIWYDVTAAQPKEVKTLGESGGVYAGPRRGETGDYRLLEPRGVGVDAEGNLYVQSMHRLTSYAPDGKVRWSTLCTHFCIASAFDPDYDGTHLYGRNTHFVYQPGQPAGKEWHWQGYTHDKRRFPELQGGAHTILRRLNDALYSFSPGIGQVVIHRQEADSYIFIPSALVRFNETMTGSASPKAAPEKVRYCWRDDNGNGLVEATEISIPAEGERSEWSASASVDSRGDIWEPQGRKGVRHIPLKGFSPSGAPIYDFADETIIPRPVDFIAVRRADYYADSDTMVLSGYTWEQQARPNEQWVGAGREIIIYDDWNKETRTIRCRIPFLATSISGHDFLPTRNLLFAAEVETAVVFCYDTRTGKLLGIIEPDPDVVGNVGWVDMPGGSLHAFERKDGEIVITVEESYLQKEMVYRLPAGFETAFQK